MASELLFDIDSIDLSAVVCTAERLGEINPQAGDMRQLDHIIWQSENADRGMGVKFVSDDEFWVAGHIPGRPILPGVLMIESAAQLCSYLFCRQVANDPSASSPPRFLGFTRCDDIVFRGQVEPGDTLYFLAKEIDFRRRRFIAATQGIVDNRLVFEGKITGMAM